jgi:hypothetical protein
MVETDEWNGIFMHIYRKVPELFYYFGYIQKRYSLMSGLDILIVKIFQMSFFYKYLSQFQLQHHNSYPTYDVTELLLNQTHQV